MKEPRNPKNQTANTVSRRNLLFGLVNRFRGSEESGAQVSGITREALEADAMAGRDEFTKAAEAYRRILETSPEAYETRAKLGWCLYKAGKLVQAKVEFKRVLRKTDNRLARLYLGLCLARQGDLPAAAQAWEDYFNPDEPGIMREINWVKAGLETGNAPDPVEAAQLVEAAADRSGGRAAT